MKLIDLTYPVEKTKNGSKTFKLEKWPIVLPKGKYTGNTYHFSHDSMVGTYIDFAGHIQETDNGIDANNFPLENLFRIDTSVIHLDKPSGYGKISADELSKACPDKVAGQALVINAIGKRRFDEIKTRSVYLESDALQWIVDTGIHILISDVYESDDDPQSVFPILFNAGISTVCQPINLHEIDQPKVKTTTMFVRYPGITQLPCRIFAEL